jgi:DNA polymerase I-like protein with 3'-5' exonuclease and polymerase domains
VEFTGVNTEYAARELIRIIPDVVAIDTEYESGNPRTTKLLLVIVADGNRAWGISPSLLPMLTPTIRARKLVFLQDYSHCDTMILLKHGCDLRGTNVHNLIDMHHLLDENAAHDLDSRIKSEFNDDYKQRFWDVYDSYESAPPDERLEYACKDGVYTYLLGCRDLECISTTPGLVSLYEHVRNLSMALFETELNGLCVNEQLIIDTKGPMEAQINAYLPKLHEQFKDYCEIWELQKWIEAASKLKTPEGRSRVARPEFNFESDKQLAWLVYGESGLGLPITARTKTKNPSTAFEVLEDLAKTNPELQTLVDFKALKGVYATFVKGMLERVDNGKIYPHFNVSGTATGRISHSDPNTGNLPKEGVIRNFFIPSPGTCIIGADYAQLEVVVELNLTDDPGLREIVCGGASKHDLFKTDLDAAGFHIPRPQVKNINFALQYGAGTQKIAKMVGCPLDDAKRIIDTFYVRFSGVKNLKADTDARIARGESITNRAGRTRKFPTPRSKYELFRQQRQAYNFLIQGVAAECCNRAYYRFHNSLWDSGSRYGRGLFPVHDEIVAEVETGMADIGMAELTRVMEQSGQDFNFKYPLTAKAYGPLTYWQKT